MKLFNAISSIVQQQRGGAVAGPAPWTGTNPQAIVQYGQLSLIHI